MNQKQPALSTAAIEKEQRALDEIRTQWHHRTRQILQEVIGKLYTTDEIWIQIIGKLYTTEEFRHDKLSANCIQLTAEEFWRPQLCPLFDIRQPGLIETSILSL